MNDLNRVEIIGALVDDPSMSATSLRFQIVSWRQPTSSDSPEGTRVEIVVPISVAEAVGGLAVGDRVLVIGRLESLTILRVWAEYVERLS